MKKIFSVVVSVLFSTQVMALEKTDVGGVQQPSVQWVHYLSAVEKAEIAGRLAKEEYFRREAAGTLHDKTQQQEISFPLSFIPIGSTSDTNKSAASVPSGGNLSCIINVQNPHAGSGPGGSTVVKAKSSPPYYLFLNTGECSCCNSSQDDKEKNSEPAGHVHTMNI